VVDCLLRQPVAHVFLPLGEDVTSGVLAKDNTIARQSDRLRRHELAGDGIPEHAMLVDSGCGGEGVVADDDLVGLDHPSQRHRCKKKLSIPMQQGRELSSRGTTLLQHIHSSLT
jgi:hypothetical protein